MHCKEADGWFIQTKNRAVSAVLLVFRFNKRERKSRRPKLGLQQRLRTTLEGCYCCGAFTYDWSLDPRLNLPRHWDYCLTFSFFLPVTTNEGIKRFIYFFIQTAG